jgi:hypothetical protein
MKIALTLITLLISMTIQKGTDANIDIRIKKLPIFTNGMSDAEIINWTIAFERLDLMDHEYVNNIKPILKKSINTLNKNEILTYITYIIRSERFNEGFLFQHKKELAFLVKKLKMNN